MNGDLNVFFQAFEDDDHLDIKAEKAYEKELNNLIKASEVYINGLDEALDQCQSS